MNEKYQYLYSDMLKDIARCEKLELPDAEWVTACFWVAHSYWERLKKLTDPNRFSSENDEIEFFRNVKPHFTQHIEYYIILSEALVCVPGEPSKAICYWELEGKRFKRFCERNEEFVRYYESGQRFKDSLYFLKRNAGINYIPKSPVYDVDPDYCTSHDHLVRSFLANKKYWEYSKERLEALARSREKIPPASG
jgi:hypothetical protein